MSPMAAESMLGALVAILGAVIYGSLRLRRASFANSLGIRAQDLYASLESSSCDFADLLYGVWQDKTAAQVELLVRDARDQQVGSVVFQAVSRKPCFTIHSQHIGGWKNRGI